MVLYTPNSNRNCLIYYVSDNKYGCPLTDVKNAFNDVTGYLPLCRPNHLTILLQGPLAGVAHESERASSGL